MAARYARLDLETLRRLQLVEAVARERVLQVRITQALGLLELADGRLDVGRMLEIYGRLHALKAPDARTLADRVLAELAHREGAEVVPDLDMAEQGPSSPRRLLRSVRRRLRGRVNTRLRRQIELHTGRSQVYLLQLHVEQALRFLEVLPQRWSIQDGVILYCERLGIEEPLAGTLYLFVTERLARVELPVPDTAPAPAVPVAPDPPSKPLRIVTSGW
ncbi:MAG TPA: hypothetical protein VMK65_11520 [Longimicrobiales bacterium]|nr:hypothetical protein [Longimicrobiales bacterium]